jgi:hypothetical protein
MNSGHTLLTLAAFILLSTLITNFYDLTGSAGDSIASGQDGILLTSITASYVEMAQGLAFDQVTDTMFIGLTNVASLTAPNALGPEAAEDSIQKFNDFDDFDGFVLDKDAGTSGRRYRTQFTVSYVDPNNLEHISSTRTFVKRLDMKTWRTLPVADGARIDTLRSSIVMGYFHFD